MKTAALTNMKKADPGLPENSKPGAANKATIETINYLASNCQAGRYLEIGVRSGGTFFHINMPHRVGVDPDFLFDEIAYSGQGRLFFRETSDAFFSRLKRETAALPAAFGESDGKPAFDVIFIDGLHTFEQSFRDFENSLPFAHENTVWILDDTVPSDPYSSAVDQVFSLAVRRAVGLTGKPWHGDVFKTVFAIHDFYPEFSYCTLMRANPQTVVWRHPEDSPGRRRTPVFSSLKDIESLNYFSLLKSAHLLMPVREEIFPALLGLRLDPASYYEPDTWKKMIYYKLSSVSPRQAEILRKLNEIRADLKRRRQVFLRLAAAPARLLARVFRFKK